MSWREQLRKLAQLDETNEFPLLVYKVNPPSATEGNALLPESEAILDFYAICDGGTIDDYRFSPLSELQSLNDFWSFNLHNYYGDETNPLIKGKHLVLAVDSAGAPLIWDKQTDLMATFWFKGGDWEPLNLSFENFMSALFSPAENNDLWFEVLQILNKRTG